MVFAGLGVVAAAVAPVAASAQGDMMAMARSAAANQLGVMEYCQKQGFADDAAVAAQRSSISRLPAGPAGESNDAAEALGRTGTVASGSTKVTLADMAGKNNTTVGALCTQMASSAMRGAAAQSSGTMPGMPSFPGGMPKIPAMPNMPTNMPSMPTMPGAPPVTR
jgi:hypothetical protein